MDRTEEQRRQDRKRRRRVVILLVFLALIGTLIFVFRAVLMPFLVALFVAYLIDPVIQRMAPARLLGKAKLGRAGSIVLVYVFFLCTLYIAGRFAVPAMGAQLRQARQDLPKLRDAIEERIQSSIERWDKFVGDPDKKDPEATTPPQATDEEPPLGEDGDSGEEAVILHLKGGGSMAGRVVARTQEQVVLELGEKLQLVEWSRIEFEERAEPRAPTTFEIREVLPQGLDQIVTRLDEVLGLALRAVGVLVGTLYKMMLIMMITAFIVIDRDKIIFFIQHVPPQQYRQTFAKLGGYIDRGLAGVIRGQIMICTVNGLLTWIGMAILGVRYAGILGLIAGVLSLIPIFGTILSSVPIVLIALGAGGVQKALLALGWILMIHFIEANFLNPKIMGTAAKIHPVVVIFALLAGEHAYGIVGALLAVPTWSIIQSSFTFYVLDRQAETGPDPGESSAPEREPEPAKA